MADIVVVSELSNLDRFHTQCNVPIILLEKTFVCSFDIQLVLKNVRRNKRVYNKCKSEKIP